MNGQQSLEELERRVGWSFRDDGLLVQALTHKSFSNEQPDATGNYERLEFLGDAVLDLVIGHRLFRMSTPLSEGELTRLRAELVNEKGLASLARELRLGEYLRLGRGERLSGGRDKDSLLANAVEALFGALYLDAGFDVARGLIEELFRQRVEAALADRQGGDYKSRLQEVIQGRFGATPHYRELQVEGPPHERLYTVALEFQGKRLAEGRGRSKKEAEQAAARRALDELNG